MNLEDFVTNFSLQFEETENEKFTPETRFKELNEWSSLVALTIIAMVDDEYHVTIKGDDIRGAVTIEDLYHIVASK